MGERSGSHGLLGFRGAPRRPLGVVVVEPLPLVRAELARLLRHQPDMELLAEVGSVQEAVAAVRPILQSRLAVVVSLGLTEERGSFWLIRSLRERFPVATIIACGGSVDPATISRALFVGADGYVDEGVEPASFVEAMRAASEGEIVLLRPGDRLARTGPGIALREELEDKLTVTELGVLAGAARGLSLGEIGWSLGLADRTVRSLLPRIYAKLGVPGPLAALRMAVRSGLVTVAAR